MCRPHSNILIGQTKFNISAAANKVTIEVGIWIPIDYWYRSNFCA